MASPSPTSSLTPAEGYRMWAATYDGEPNPMLSLEERILGPLLPRVTGLDVVDLGCGTGRWLHALIGSGPRSLLGVDPSPEMLAQAKAKLGEQAAFICGPCTDFQIPSSSADLILCNFVLSYVENLEQFLEVAARILRPGGSLFLSDLHPDTAASLQWRRGVRADEEFKEIQTANRSISDVTGQCEKIGLHLRLRLEPRFGDGERIIFQQNKKQEYFDQIRDYPAIFLLQCILPEQQKKTSARKTQRKIVETIRGARLALGPSDTACGEIRVSSGAVETIGCFESQNISSPESTIELPGHLILPGLINAHDHLEFALFPRLGRGGYQNFMEWAEDIHRSHASEIARHRQVPRHVRLWWGGIRNALCGVTTVCHHNPYEPVFSDEFIVRVLKNYEWAHSLPLEPDGARKKKHVPKGQPFFIHLAEGIDAQSAKEIFDLREAGALDEDTVLIHGLGLSEQGSTLLRNAGAGLVWCPSSNLFLFGKSMSPEQIRQFPKVALGSDSPLTAQGDLLDEVSCAHQFMETPAPELYRCVTQQPARLLALENGEGTIRVGGAADLIAVRDAGLTPAETLTTLSYRQIDLVVLRGRVQLASDQMKCHLPEAARKGLQPLSVEGVVRWIRAPLDWLFEETQVRLGSEIYLGGKKVCLGS